MVDVGPFHMRSGAIGDRQQLRDAGPSLPALNSGISLTERLLDDARHAFTRGAGDRSSEPVGFRVFDVEAHAARHSVKTSTLLPFYPSSWSAPRANPHSLVMNSKGRFSFTNQRRAFDALAHDRWRRNHGEGEPGTGGCRDRASGSMISDFTKPSGGCLQWHPWPPPGGTLVIEVDDLDLFISSWR
jgi:hypothetical protein